MKQKFLVADLNAIETRVAAWLSGCQSLMDVFIPRPGLPNGRDPYIDFASKIWGVPYDKLWNDLQGLNGKEAKKQAKIMRQTAKPGVLGAVYRMGGGGWANGKASYKDPETGEKIYDKVRTGLWGYAYAMGVEMDQEKAHMLVRIFRDAYPEIPQCWKLLEDSVMAVMDPEHPDTKRRVGPNGCVLIDRLNITGRLPLLRMRLPSGRRLHYLDAEILDTKMPWQDHEGNAVYRPALWYANEDQNTHKWSSVTTHGGKTFENAVQGIARDILAAKLLLFEENDMPVVLHVHDEGGSLVLDDPFSPTVERMIQIMSEPVSWAPGLLLGADGWEGSFYHK
jgi:DNA polymerase